MITNLTLFLTFMQFATIDGRVYDAQSRRALALVRVELLQQGVPRAMDYTDADGQFHFRNVSIGTYTISVTTLGYDSTSVEFDSNMPFPLEVALSRTVRHGQPDPAVISAREYMLPEAARKEFDRAQKESRQGNCVKAIQHFENGLNLVPQASAFNDLGNCYRKLGKLSSAEASFKHAVELSDSVYVALNLAEVYTAQKRFDEARAVLETAAARNSANGDAYYGLALVYFKQEKLEDAESAALQANARIHRIADVHLLLAKIYAQKNPAGVVEQLELYLSEAPNGLESKRVREVLQKI